nr:hypothetical protein [Desulfosporosinus metallidurans]
MKSCPHDSIRLNPPHSHQ